MKRIVPVIAIFLAGLLCLSSCGKGKETVTAVGTTKAEFDSVEVGSMIIRPPTRSANSQYEAYRCSLSLVELWETADAVAWVSIGNWLSETDYGSYYDAAVVKCYKGVLPSTIVLEQAGTSVKTYTDFPLFTYGNEFLVFLQNWDADALSAAGPYGSVDDLPIFGPSVPELDSPEHTLPDEQDHIPAESDRITGEDQMMPIPEVGDETDVFWSGPLLTYSEQTMPPWWDATIKLYPVQTQPPSDSNDTPAPEPAPEPVPPYEHCYQLLSGVALLDAAVGLDGDVYLLDRYYLVDPYLGLTATTQRPSGEITADVLQVLSARDAYCHRLFSERILYRLADLLEYLENPQPGQNRSSLSASVDQTKK